MDDNGCIDDHDAVVATVTDYWQGWFTGSAQRMQHALHPALTKTGAVIDATGAAAIRVMTAEDMIGWTRDGVGVAEAGKHPDFAFEATVEDIHHQIATVTVRSGIYREYLHLVRTPDGWRILNALYMGTRED
jgi:Putative lumazine-binding